MIRKICLSLLLASGLGLSAFAQQGNNQVGVAADMGVPVGFRSYKVGFGGQLRGLIGVGANGQVSLTTGYLHFKGKNEVFGNEGFSISMIPILAGYRLHLHELFVEPQAGINFINTKFPSGTVDNEKWFAYAIGGGYAKNAFEWGIRYQHSQNSELLGLHVGYNLSFGKKR